MADDETLPYLNASGNITKVLKKIKEAETPPRFTGDYLATTLQMPGGSPKPVIPFLKRTGFLASDGVPTELYKRFRGSESGAAAADALRQGYKALYRVNEYAHDATDPKLKDLIVQVTGAEKASARVGAIASSFKALKAFADFSGSAKTTGGADERPAVMRLAVTEGRRGVCRAVSNWDTRSTCTSLRPQTSPFSMRSSVASRSI